MMSKTGEIKIGDIVFLPLKSDRWEDFVTLFGEHGASGGCWCMFWRLPRSNFQQNCRNCGEANRLALQELVRSCVVPGLVGYQAGRPIVWISVAPREDFSALERSRTLKRLDDKAVWSIVCFYVDRQARNTGAMLAAIQAAVEYARRSGAELVEAYPTVVERHHAPGDLYMGNLATFLTAGFTEMEIRGAHRIVRLEL